MATSRTSKAKAAAPAAPAAPNAELGAKIQALESKIASLEKSLEACSARCEAVQSQVSQQPAQSGNADLSKIEAKLNDLARVVARKADKVRRI